MYGDGRPSQVTTTAVAVPASSNGGVRTAQPVARPGVVARVANLAVDYKYVPADLKRLGITAAALFALMIVLGFIIR